MAKIGIIGGSGIYDLEGVEKKGWQKVETPFGEPSSEYLLARLGDKEIVFLPRHGRNHTIPPSFINYRANIYGFKLLGAERIISVSACGSLQEEIEPLSFVIPDQFVDRTNQARPYTFFGRGIVAHVSFARPVCAELSQLLFEAGQKAGVKIKKGGTYLNMEGPQFSTLAESKLYRQWGMDIIGMTNLAEARLAKEAEICYATLAAVTDYDCWRQSTEEVTAEMVIDNLKKNVANAKKILSFLIPRIPAERKCACQNALDNAIVTSLSAVAGDVKEELRPIIGRFLKD